MASNLDDDKLARKSTHTNINKHLKYKDWDIAFLNKEITLLKLVYWNYFVKLATKSRLNVDRRNKLQITSANKVL